MSTTPQPEGTFTPTPIPSVPPDVEDVAWEVKHAATAVEATKGDDLGLMELLRDRLALLTKLLWDLELEGGEGAVFVNACLLDPTKHHGVSGLYADLHVLPLLHYAVDELAGSPERKLLLDVSAWQQCAAVAGDVAGRVLAALEAARAAEAAS